MNRDLGLLEAAKADAIIAAATEIAEGRHDDQFPIDVFQTGSGTSSNMNANEVIASIAKARGVEVHPNDDVNMSQSSNDTFPTATHLAATEAVIADLVPALDHLRLALLDKSTAWKTVVKSGRTHLMDAVPVTLGQEFGGYTRQVAAGIDRIMATLPRLGELPIGGTASAPASTHRTDSAGWSSRNWCAAPASTRCAKPRTISRPRPRVTAWWRPRVRCAPSPSA